MNKLDELKKSGLIDKETKEKASELIERLNRETEKEKAEIQNLKNEISSLLFS